MIATIISYHILVYSDIKTKCNLICENDIALCFNFISLNMCAIHHTCYLLDILFLLSSVNAFPF